MNILIIGSKGFIGHGLELYFAGETNKVYACDIIDASSSNYYTKIEPQNPDYSMLFMKTKFDVCINCSGAAVVLKSFEETENDFKLNVFNVVKILEAIKRYNPECKFINISSAAVYGNPAILPVSEKNRLLPMSPYGYHKLITETVLDEYYSLWGLKTCSARIFSAYGNGLKKQLLFDISRKILFEREIHLFGTGKETRDFIHIDDICNAFGCIIAEDNFQSTKINVANGKQVTIDEIIKIFNENWKHDKRIIFDAIERIGDPINWEADISLLKSYGYKQTVGIEAGVKRYISWVKNERLE
jgi:dTDP-glucose 4,6-dehydratase/UDP-glucose 4-epimerase